MRVGSLIWSLKECRCGWLVATFALELDMEFGMRSFEPFWLKLGGGGAASKVVGLQRKDSLVQSRNLRLS